MLEMLVMVGTGAVSLWGYLKARKFVRERLRFVDAAHTPAAAVIAGAVAGTVVWLLPLIGPLSGFIFGVGIGAGVLHGSRDVRKQLPPI